MADVFETKEPHSNLRSGTSPCKRGTSNLRIIVFKLYHILDQKYEIQFPKIL